MALKVAFFARSLAIVSLVLAACSSSGGGAHVDGSPDRGSAGVDGGGSGGSSAGNDGGGPGGGAGVDSGGPDGGAAGVDGGNPDGDAEDVDDGNPDGDGGGPDGGNADVDVAGDATEALDAGWKAYAAVPQAPPTSYTCASEIHVATTGDDTGGDGTSGMPYKTIGKGIAMATAAGACVQVHAGTYTPAATLTFPSDGTAGNPIVLRSADGRGMAIIDGSAVTAAPTVEVNKDHVVIDGFEFKNKPQSDGAFVVRFDGQSISKCEGSVLRNSKLTGGFSQLKIYQKTHGVVIENNEFSGPTANSTASLTGASGLLFRANYLHDIDTGDLGTTELVGGSTGATFEKNLFQDISTASGALVFGDACGATCDNDPEHYAAVNALAWSNIFIRVRRALDILGCKNCSVLSNTIIDAGVNAGYVFRIGSANTNGVVQPTTGLRIIDNLLASPSALMGYVMDLGASSSTGLNMDYNLFYDGPAGLAFGATHPATADTHSVLGDPLFVGPTDLRPGAGSPAIGAGTNLVSDVPQDFLNVTRPASGAFDIGAVQH
ncbi:MAG TPA: DUF1565 domain-containing protein [Polyangia bacterium]